jgi:hypothetical protein
MRGVTSSVSKPRDSGRPDRAVDAAALTRWRAAAARRSTTDTGANMVNPAGRSDGETGSIEMTRHLQSPIFLFSIF